MKTNKPGMVESIVAASNLSKFRFVGFDGNYCAANAKALGVSEVDTNLGEYCPVAVSGIVLIETAGAITAGAAIVASGTGADAGKAAAAANLSVSSAITSSINAGATQVTSSAANGEIVTSTSVNTISGSVLSQTINGYALDAAAGAGEIIRIKLV